MDVHVGALFGQCGKVLTRLVSVDVFHFLALFGQPLPCLNYPAEQRLIGTYVNIRIIISLTLYRVFTQAEVELARARMPTEAKPLTGFFKWKDIKRWHKTWHVYLCKGTENTTSIYSAN